MTSTRGRFTQSAPFQRLMHQYSIERHGDERLVLIHNECQEDVIRVEAYLDLNTLVEAVLDHDCHCED